MNLNDNNMDGDNMDGDNMDNNNVEEIHINIKEIHTNNAVQINDENVITLLGSTFNALKASSNKNYKINVNANENNSTSISVGDENYFAESASDLSDTYSEDSNSNIGVCENVFLNSYELDKMKQNKTKNKKFKKLNYKQVELSVDKYYSDINHKYSSALDILASYLKGQKIIYMEAKTYSEQQLNKLMMPAILLSTAATVLSSVVQYYTWGATLISSVNALIAFLLALVNYFKLDAASEAHKMSAHQYDKLQTSVVFTSGSILLFRDFTMNDDNKHNNNNNNNENNNNKDKDKDKDRDKDNLHIDIKNSANNTKNTKRELEIEMMNKL